jgi:UDP-N-acetylglucosamine acyltransferase
VIHPTAIVDSPVPDSVEVGPWAIVGPDVTLGEGVVIGPHAVVTGPLTAGIDVRIGPSAVIGTDPQDLKYAGEKTSLEIGDRTVIREFANINRGTAKTGRTVIGSDCFVMAYVHIAHDCRIGTGVILANAVNVAGHVEIGDGAVIGGVVPVHQFVRIGAYSMIGGGYRVSKDVPPFCLTGGYPLKVVSLNTVGLRRSGFDDARLTDLEKAFRFLFRENGSLTDKVNDLLARDDLGRDARDLAEFILSSTRGVVS